MYERFSKHFQRDLDSSNDSEFTRRVDANEPQLRELFQRFAGVSFNNGLYRVMTAGTQELAHQFVSCAFPGFAAAVACFGFDWLGRIFAMDLRKQKGTAPIVFMFEPGTSEALEIPCDVVSFHDVELLDQQEAALAANFHQEWIASGAATPTQSQCVGYKRPLFLGGKDNLGNLELLDLDVYWTLMAQLIGQMRGLPVGTRVGNVKIDT
jgi:type VI secretion system (T6SS) immunity protein Tdi1